MSVPHYYIEGFNTYPNVISLVDTSSVESIEDAWQTVDLKSSVENLSSLLQNSFRNEYYAFVNLYLDSSGKITSRN